jgi:hypothetical protein
MAEWLIRLLVGLTVAIVVGVVQVLAGVVRLGLRLLGLVGFRGARLAALAATLAGVWWAAGVVEVGPAARLALIGWAAWATRHHRAAIRQHAAVRRLTAALERHTGALAAAAKRGQASPGPGAGPATTAPPQGAPACPPWPTADQTPEQTLGALGRHAAAWAARHGPPAAPGGASTRPTVPERRPPR